jgi:citrate synthase
MRGMLWNYESCLCEKAGLVCALCLDSIAICCIGATAAGNKTDAHGAFSLLLWIVGSRLVQYHAKRARIVAVRAVGSSHVDPFSAVSAGIAALYGPLHGGANEAVLEMLEQIRDQGGDVAGFVRQVKDREAGARLMGFGHRVYKNYDPRAAIIKKTTDDILGRLGKSDQLLDIAKQLEEVALGDDYFVERKLYPNVDFYTGVIYKAMGFPTNMFTVLFALGRLPGWIAQWREMLDDSSTKIGRPRQVYVGPNERHYVEQSAR